MGTEPAIDIWYPQCTVWPAEFVISPVEKGVDGIGLAGQGTDHDTLWAGRIAMSAAWCINEMKMFVTRVEKWKPWMTMKKKGDIKAGWWDERQRQAE